MGRGTTYYTIYHTGGKTHILVYGEHDAIEQFRKNYPDYTIENRGRCALIKITSPFEPKIVDSELYARGSSDDKSRIAYRM
ncbi:MAG: hypothetical protein IJX51_06995 [Clostridia bacterium]|nr:hypothetical protein [Clostridia bacterium]